MPKKTEMERSWSREKNLDLASLRRSLVPWGICAETFLRTSLPPLLLKESLAVANIPPTAAKAPTPETVALVPFDDVVELFDIVFYIFLQLISSIFSSFVV